MKIKLSKTKIILLILCGLFLSFIVAVYQTMVIKKFPSCITYSFAQDKPLNFNENAQLESYFAQSTLSTTQKSDRLNEWESDTTFVMWSSLSWFTLFVCTKDETSFDWLTVASGIQDFLLKMEPGIKADITLNPQIKHCNGPNNKSLSAPVDMDALKKAISCT